MMEAEVSCRVDGVVGEPLAEMMTVRIPGGPSVYFQDKWETRSALGNIFDSALARTIERGHLNDLIHGRMTRIVDTEYSMACWLTSSLGARRLSHQSLGS